MSRLCSLNTDSGRCVLLMRKSCASVNSGGVRWLVNYLSHKGQSVLCKHGLSGYFVLSPISKDCNSHENKPVLVKLCLSVPFGVSFSVA